MKNQNNIFLRLSLAVFIIVFTIGCNSEKQTIITVTVKDKSGNPQSDRKVYEFEYAATHQLGNNPFVANKFRLSDNLGRAVFILDDYEYDKSKETNTLYFTVFHEVSGDTYTVAGSVKVDFRVGDSATANLIVD